MLVAAASAIAMAIAASAAVAVLAVVRRYGILANLLLIGHAPFVLLAGYTIVFSCHLSGSNPNAVPIKH